MMIFAIAACLAAGTVAFRVANKLPINIYPAIKNCSTRFYYKFTGSVYAFLTLSNIILNFENSHSSDDPAGKAIGGALIVFFVAFAGLICAIGICFCARAKISFGRVFASASIYLSFLTLNIGLSFLWHYK